MTAREPRPPLPPGGGCPWCENLGCEHCCGGAVMDGTQLAKPPSLREALEALVKFVASLPYSEEIVQYRTARAALAAPPERELLPPDERAERAHKVLVGMVQNMLGSSSGIERLLRNLADPPPCESGGQDERRP